MGQPRTLSSALSFLCGNNDRTLCITIHYLLYFVRYSHIQINRSIQSRSFNFRRISKLPYFCPIPLPHFSGSTQWLPWHLLPSCLTQVWTQDKTRMVSSTAFDHDDSPTDLNQLRRRSVLRSRNLASLFSCSRSPHRTIFNTILDLRAHFSSRISSKEIGRTWKATTNCHSKMCPR